jgi:hypothetical protein
MKAGLLAQGVNKMKASGNGQRSGPISASIAAKEMTHGDD